MLYLTNIDIKNKWVMATELFKTSTYNRIKFQSSGEGFHEIKQTIRTYKIMHLLNRSCTNNSVGLQTL